MSTSEDDYASSDSEAYAYDSRDEASFDESSFESYDDETSGFFSYVHALDEDGDQRVSWGEFRGAVLGATPWGAE